MKNETSGDITAPALPGDSLPKVPGRYEFLCSFFSTDHPEKRGTFREYIAEAIGGTISMSASVDGTDFLQGTFSADKKGNLIWTSIYYKSEKGEITEIPPAQSLDQKKSTSSLKLNSQTIEFSCERQ
jgi:hypothetical protein